MTANRTEDQWEDLYRSGPGAPKYPNGHVVRWLFGSFPRARAADFHLLDMGCGMGRHAVMMKREGYGVSATDYSAAAIDQAIKWTGGIDIDFRQAPADKQPFPDRSFDGILSYAVLYYLPLEKMQQAFREIRRLLKPGGRSFVMIKNNRDIRVSKGEEVAPHHYIITRKDSGMPWNNEQNMQLTLLPRQEVEEICRDFSKVVINEMTGTLDGGRFLEAAWLISLTR